MANIILIYITNSTKQEARKIAKVLLAKKLIACANIWPIDSVYRWRGKIKQEKEFALLAKTLAGKFAAAKKEVEKIHLYSIPCLIKISAQTNKKYFIWLTQELK